MFDSAKQKIERADHHIAELERQFAAFIAKKPNRLSIQPNPTGSLTLSVRFVEKLPRAIAPIIGDAIHNLRSALDHATWEFVGRDHGTQNRYLKFPTGDSRISFESSCDGIETPSQWVIDTVKATEAFIGGKGTDLYNLNQLDNADKHIEITPVLRAVIHPRYHVVDKNGVTHRTIERQTLVADRDLDVVILAEIPAGFSPELDNDAQFIPSVFFSHPDVPIASPAISTLRRYSDAVALVIESFERATSH
jgi:hypothetical protein